MKCIQEDITLVSGQNTASRNTRGRKTIGQITTQSNYQTVKIPDD